MTEKHGTNNKEPGRFILKGEGISPGYARGKAFVYIDILTRDLQTYTIHQKNVGKEMDRIHSAIEQVSENLNEQKKTVEKQSDHFNAAIFDFHKEILKDKQLNTDLTEELETELVNAEIVVRNVFRKLSEKLRTSRNKTIRSKADDLDDLSNKILRILIGYESNILETLPSDSIIVAKRLLPSDTVHLKRDNLRGIVVEEGSGHSHSALLARAFGITAVANITRLFSSIHNGDELLLDGKEGLVIAHPTDEDREIWKKKKRNFSLGARETLKHTQKPAGTKCGKLVKIYANAYSEKDFEIAYRNGCDGIGLSRLEQLYMSFKELPGENDIYEHLRETFKKFPEKQITVRLLDVGGDKKLPYLEMEKERNSFLGVRGIRFLLRNKEILRDQIKAALRLSDLFPLRLLIPMVTLPEEIARVHDVIRECRRGLIRRDDKEYGGLDVGAMIETPAAVYGLEDISRHVDFLSIGTNDLLQYIMAAGRENADVADYYEKGTALILKIIKNIVEVGQANGTEVNICGELAGDTRWTKELLLCGIRHFSVSPYRIPELKKKISSFSLDEISESDREEVSI